MEFLDTNVLVYAASDKAADQQKAGVARDLLRRDPDQFAIVRRRSGAAAGSAFYVSSTVFVS